MFEILLLSALITDCILGDPKWFPHPVRSIGWLCLSCESLLRKRIKSEKLAGTITSIIVLVLTSGGTMLFLHLLGFVSYILQIVASVFVIYTFIAIKDLLLHSKDVYDNLLPDENIEKARIAVGRIVGRDTSNLNREDICRACVETVAENMVDGITAPLFWAIVMSFLSYIFPVNPIVLAAFGISKGFIVEPVFGRPRFYDLWKLNIIRRLNNSDGYDLSYKETREANKQKASIERESKNQPIQGAAAAILKISGVLLRRWIRNNNLTHKVRLLLPPHDEWCVEAKDGLEQLVNDKLKHYMELAGRLGLSTDLLKAEPYINEHWVK